LAAPTVDDCFLYFAVTVARLWLSHRMWWSHAVCCGLFCC